MQTLGAGGGRSARRTHEEVVQDLVSFRIDFGV